MLTNPPTVRLALKRPRRQPGTVNDISFACRPGTFTDAIFNPPIVGTIGTPAVPPQLRLWPRTRWPILSHSPPRYSHLGNGENFLTIVASNGEVIGIA